MRIKSILLALVLPIVSAGSLFAQQTDTLSFSGHMLPTIHYTDGIRLAAEGLTEEALGKFEQAIGANPDHDPSLYEAANALAALGRTEKALEYSTRAVSLDPENRWYGEQQARLLFLLEKHDEAIAFYESMLGGHSFNPDNYRMLAMLYYRKGRMDDALATLDSAEMHMGMTADIAGMRRGLLIEAGRMEEAVVETEKWIAANPYDEENRLVLAEMYAYQRRDSLGMATLKDILRINPDNTGALGSLAGMYMAKGQMPLYFSTMKQLLLEEEVPLEEKIVRMEDLTRNTNFYRNHFMETGDLLLTLVTRYPDRVEAVELYADHSVRSGDGEGALAMLKTQLGKPEPRLSSFMKVIEIEAYLGRADSVTLYGDRAIAAYPDQIRIYLLRSSALQYMGRSKDARKTLVRALKAAETDSIRSEIYGAIGTLWHEEGNGRKTFANYEKALLYDSNNALVLNNYAYFLALEGRDLDRALGMASRAIKLQENFATYLDTYAWVLYRLGNFTEAKKAMQQALPLDRDQSPELLIHYGDILRALGEDFMASVYWKRARDAGHEPASEIEERLAGIK